MAVAVVAMGMMTANAQTVWNVNFGTDSSTKGILPGQAKEITTGDNFVGAATENTANSTWTPVVGVVTALALADSTGSTAAGVTLTVPSGGGGFDGQTQTTGAEIWSSYLGGAGLNRTITLGGLIDSATYDLVVYAGWRHTDVNTRWEQTVGSGLSGYVYVNGQDTDINGALTQDTDPTDNTGAPGNWYRITGLTPAGNQLAFNVVGGNDALSGFQLIAMSADPAVALAGKTVAANAPPGTLVGNLSMVNVTDLTGWTYTLAGGA